MAVQVERRKKPRPPLDAEALERLALLYVGRYATTRAKLVAYLGRKVEERGWNEERRPDLEGLVERLSGLGYVNDAAFAAARAASLQRRGFGERRIGQALHAAGIGEADAAEARERLREGALAAALRYAKRRRIGPYAPEAPDREALRKAFAAMVRAGHPADTIRQVLEVSPAEIPECDSL